VHVYAHTNVYIYLYMCDIVAFIHTFIRFVYTYFPYKNSVTIKRFDGPMWQTCLTDWMKTMKTPLFTKRPPIVIINIFGLKIFGLDLEEMELEWHLFLFYVVQT
jgi:hypothetical protein